MVEVVYTSVNNEIGVRGTLFEGLKFWLSRKVPQRSKFIEEVQANGGEVVPLEKQANILIVDHARKEGLPGSHSYQFIERSIRNGRREKLEDHVVGPPVGTIRTVGSATQPAKIHRRQFTENDDRILLDWVESGLREGLKTKGNEIYKQLEAMYPQHTWQSWRDRWVRHFKDNHASLAFDEESPRSPIAPRGEGDASGEVHLKVETTVKAESEFSEKDAITLMENGRNIRGVEPEALDTAWEKWAHQQNDGKFPDEQHSAQEWRNFWENSILPIYLKRLERSEKSSEDPQDGKTHPMQKKHARTPSPASRNNRQKAAHIQSPELLLARESSRRGSRSKRISSESDIEEPKIDPAGSPDVWYPAFEAPADDIHVSPKRKRAASVDEFPSSSPHVEAANKRQKRHESYIPTEIAATPEQSPTRHVDFGSRKSHRHVGFIDANTEIDVDYDKASESEDRFPTQNGNQKEPKGLDHLREEGNLLGRQASPILSESRDKTPGTQNRSSKSGLFIDLDVAPPANGWQGILLPDIDSSSSPELSPSPTRLFRPKTQIEETQAPAESQLLPADIFSVAPPDGGWDSADGGGGILSDNDNTIPSSSFDPPTPSSPTPSEIGDLLDGWINERVAAGFSSENVHSALKCTSIDTDLAEVVLDYMKSEKGGGSGSGIPSDVAGVWTQRDDAWLQSVDARRVKELEKKHGAYVQKRWQFLKACGSGNEND